MASCKRLKTLCLFAASATVLLAAGCSQPASENDTATSKAEISEFQTIAHTQEAAGARANARSIPINLTAPRSAVWEPTLWTSSWLIPIAAIR